ncbi:MAG TPA: carboxypeptidase-like regulatory domain-containing protein, partial [Polyangiaceae bacterium]|nr:carboxypeptidase-like regulatory domain-containing protein [Polyangiaceae bacterium]
MPHRKAFSIDGAVAVVPISTFILAVAIVLASPARAVLGPVVDPVLRSLRKSLGWAPSIDVVSDSQAVVVAVAGARIFVAGRILDADGGPVAGSAVRVQSEAWPGWDWVTSSGSDGSFHVDGVAAGKVRVAAQDVEAGTMETASLDADEARDVVLVLDRTVEVSGVVLDERSAPIARAAVKGA